jgi:hypothetical protein
MKETLPARAMLFSMAAMIVYTIAEYDNWSFLRYYLLGGFSFGARGGEAGHFILWYGWVATAALAGLVIAALAPKKLLARLPADLVWMVMIAAILAVAVYEKRWFA